MSDWFSIAVDNTAVLAALTRIPAAVLAHVKPEAKITAERIATETRRRFARARGGATRGSAHTVEGVTVAETYKGDGYVIFVTSPEMPGLPGWLEFGTRFMTPRPAGGALFPSARLEEDAHDRRVRAAVQDAIDEEGLGD